MKQRLAWPLGISMAILLVALIGGLVRRGAYAGSEHRDEAPPAEVVARVVTVERGTLAPTLRVLGTAEALPNQRATLAAQIGGRIVTLTRQRGERVRAGEVVATIFQAELVAAADRARADQSGALREAQRAQVDVAYQRAAQAAQLKQEEAALQAAQARLEKLHAGNRPEEIAEARALLQREQAELERLQRGQRPEEIERADATARAVEAELQKLRAGSRPQELAQAEAALRSADAQWVAAKKKVERVQALYDDGLAAGKEVERAQADLASMHAKADQAREQLKLLREGPRSEDIRAQEAKLREAQAALRLARAGFRSEEIRAQQANVEMARQALTKVQAGFRSEEIREAEFVVQEAEAKLTRARAGRLQLQSAAHAASAAQHRAAGARAVTAGANVMLGKAQVVAPVSGVVEAVLTNRGEVVAAGAPLLELINTNRFRVVAHVPAMHQGQLRLGGPATVTFPHLGAEAFATAVAVIGPAASHESGLIAIELRLPKAPARIKEGMAAEVTLALAPVESVVVMTSALFARAGESYIYIVDAQGTAHERAVETGLEQAGRTQIVKGLNAGERVVVDGTLSLADGVRIRGGGSTAPLRRPGKNTAD